ncbi:hypothetical protein X975_17650, partial [Stegodyphus mimosarum]
MTGQNHQTGRTEDSQLTGTPLSVFKKWMLHYPMLYHNIASSHSARSTVEFLEQKHLKVTELHSVLSI